MGIVVILKLYDIQIGDILRHKCVGRVTHHQFFWFCSIFTAKAVGPIVIPRNRQIHDQKIRNWSNGMFGERSADISVVVMRAKITLRAKVPR